MPQPLGSYRRPGRSENEPDTPNSVTFPWRSPRRRILFGSSVAVIIVAIIVAVVLAITLSRKTSLNYINQTMCLSFSDCSSKIRSNNKRILCGKYLCSGKI